MKIPSFTKGQKLRAEDMQALANAVRANRVLPGAGIRITGSPNGTTIAASARRRSEALGTFAHPFAIVASPPKPPKPTPTEEEPEPEERPWEALQFALQVEKGILFDHTNPTNTKEIEATLEEGCDDPITEAGEIFFFAKLTVDENGVPETLEICRKDEEPVAEENELLFPIAFFEVEEREVEEATVLTIKEHHQLLGSYIWWPVPPMWAAHDPEEKHLQIGALEDEHEDALFKFPAQLKTLAVKTEDQETRLQLLNDEDKKQAKLLLGAKDFLVELEANNEAEGKAALTLTHDECRLESTVDKNLASLTLEGSEGGLVQLSAGETGDIRVDDDMAINRDMGGFATISSGEEGRTTASLGYGRLHLTHDTADTIAEIQAGENLVELRLSGQDGGEILLTAGEAGDLRVDQTIVVGQDVGGFATLSTGAAGTTTASLGHGLLTLANDSNTLTISLDAQDLTSEHAALGVREFRIKKKPDEEAELIALIAATSNIEIKDGEVIWANYSDEAKSLVVGTTNGPVETAKFDLGDSAHAEFSKDGKFKFQGSESHVLIHCGEYASIFAGEVSINTDEAAISIGSGADAMTLSATSLNISQGGKTITLATEDLPGGDDGALSLNEFRLKAKPDQDPITLGYVLATRPIEIEAAEVLWADYSAESKALSIGTTEGPVETATFNLGSGTVSLRKSGESTIFEVGNGSTKLEIEVGEYAALFAGNVSLNTDEGDIVIKQNDKTITLSLSDIPSGANGDIKLREIEICEGKKILVLCSEPYGGED